MMLALVGFNANAAIYLVGEAPFGQGWDPSKGVEMTDNGDGTFTFTAAVNGTVYFCFADGFDATWDVFNGTYRFGPLGGQNQTVTPGQWMTTQRQGNGSGSYMFQGTGDDYTVTFDLTSMQFKVEGYVAPITYDIYSVASSLNGWDEKSADYEMTLVNGLYTLTMSNVEVPVGNIEYKVVADHDWQVASWPASNATKAIDKHGYYDVTFTFNESTKAVDCQVTLLEEIEDPIIENHTYTVAGNNTTLFGSEWAPTDTNNDMTLVNGLYTWTKENVALTAGSIEFKVVMDHDWNNGVNAWPSENYVANIEANGDYNVVITFNEETKEINFTATPVVVTEDFYTVAGEPAAIFGEEWTPSYAANNMTLVDGLYTWTKDSVKLTEGQKIEFKVVKNANWSTCWPENNYVYTCPEADTYNLVITYNPENNEVTFAANKVGGEEPPVEMVYTAVGPEAVFGSDWDVTDTNNDMVLDAETGLYTWTADSVDLTTEGFGFKVVGNHDWANEWPQGYGNNWIVNIAEAGKYNLVITFDAETGEINCTATKVDGGEEPPVVEITVYTVVGPEAIFGSEWDATDENNDMTLADGVYTWSADSVELSGSFGFKVVGNHDYAVYEYPMGYDNNWIAYVEEPGIYNIEITFDPEAADSARVTCTLTKLEAVEMVYTAVGPAAVFGTEWDETDTNNDMVLDPETGLYTWTKNGVDLTTDGFGFKVVGNHTWANEWPQGYENNWIVNIDEDGKYNIVITFNAATGEINCVTTKVVEPAWELGDVNHSGGVDIEDVTMLINAVLGTPAAGYYPEQANCDGEGSVDIADVTALINRVLSGTW